MSSNKCARCEQTVYPVEGLRCLDKIWHKGCFKCHECNMTLSLKNYKGFEKRPYCNAHCPQAKATTVADTPESRRLAENTRIQSQAKYHEDFERSKGKGFTAIADDPETLRIKNTSKIISNVAYHGELERKKQMEERRGISGPEENAHSINNNNNNSGKHLNMMQHSVVKAPNLGSQDGDSPAHVRPGNYPNQNQYHIQSQQLQQHQQQQIHQQQLQHQKQQQQLLLKQQQQMLYAQDLNNGGHHPIIERQHINGPTQQQLQAKQIMQQYPIGHPQHQQFMLRQQQQHQLMMQQQRQSLQDASLLMGHHQAVKQSNNNYPQQQQQQQQMIKHVISASQLHPQQQQQQQQHHHQMKYMPMNDSHHQPSPTHQMMLGPPAHLINTSPLPGLANNQRAPNSAAMMVNGPPHQLMHGYGQQMGHQMNGVMPKQQQFAIRSPQHAIHHPVVGQMQPNMANHQMRAHNQQMQPTRTQQQQQQHQQQVPRRVFRAMYDYVANDVDEVSFFENDILIDCVNVDGNWLIGKVARSGQTGMLPANYVTEFSSQ